MSAVKPKPLPLSAPWSHAAVQASYALRKYERATTFVDERQIVARFEGEAVLRLHPFPQRQRAFVPIRGQAVQLEKVHCPAHVVRRFLFVGREARMSTEERERLQNARVPVASVAAAAVLQVRHGHAQIDDRVFGDHLVCLQHPVPVSMLTCFQV